MKFKELIRNPHIYFPFFFAGCCLYFLLVFYPSLYYHLHQPMFLFSGYFFNEFLLHLGGISEWLGQFIEQFFYSDLVGALIISIFFTGIYYIVFRIIKKLADVRLAIVLAFLPVSFLLTIQNSYIVTFLIKTSLSFRLFVQPNLFLVIQPLMLANDKYRLNPGTMSIRIGNSDTHIVSFS